MANIMNDSFKSRESSIQFVDILSPRRNEKTTLLWIFRAIDPKLTHKKETYKPTPQSLKEAVLSSQVNEIIQKSYSIYKIPQNEMEKQIRQILDEIGYEKSLKLIRWLALVLVKILLKISSGLFINERSILHVKDSMGNCPVIFVPSHRSYADFILMSYVMFHYDIAIPAIAAGMDFQGMMVMGTMLRHTGAFYMRRSYNDDSLYWTTFKEYIHQLVTKGDLPIEFFIEGTRSRSGKSLVPKFGFLNMILKSFFLSEVPDIMIVPVSISYERILEEKLFSFELLGVPKPKETTSGFFKSLSILHENFGRIYFNVASPISVKAYFENKSNRSQHSLGPIHQELLTEYERTLLQPLAFDIVNIQQKHSILTTFNIMSVVLSYSLTVERRHIMINEMIRKVDLVRSILHSYGANLDIGGTKTNVEHSLKIHKNYVTVVEGDKIVLVNENILANYRMAALKGHNLSAETVTYCVPFIILQIYINPVMCYLVDSSLIVTILRHGMSASREQLLETYMMLRNLFSHEFVTPIINDSEKFEDTIIKMKEVGLIEYTDYSLELVDETQLQDLMTALLQPFIDCYFVVLSVLVQSSTLNEKSIFVAVQKYFENLISTKKLVIHPYCLSLDTISNCLNSSVSLRILKRSKENSGVVYVLITNVEPFLQKLDVLKTNGLPVPNVSDLIHLKSIL